MQQGSPTEPGAPPHAQPASSVADQLGVDPRRGLSAADAKARLAAEGANVLEARRPPSLLQMLWRAVTQPFIVLLLVAGLVAVVLGEARDGLLILLGLVPIVGADVATSYRAERALETLRASAAPTAQVRRDGRVSQRPVAELVRGDVVLLAVGDVVPADLRLIRVDGLLVDRAAISGESLPDAGSVTPDAADAPLVERHSVAYSGTNVVQGRGEGIVIATGASSELGTIASRLGGEERRRSPIQLELDRLVRILLVVAIGLIAITGGLALWRGEPPGVALLAGVSAAIAAIPEEPPVMLAVILGLGAYRLLRRGVLVRRLNAQETLSAVDLIVTDKTGTLTRNRLRLELALTPAGPLVGEELRSVLETAYRAQEDAWQRATGARAGSFTQALEAALDENGGRPVLDPTELIDAEPVRDGRPYTRIRALRDGLPEEHLLGAHEHVLDLVDRVPSGTPSSSAGWPVSDWYTLAEAQAEEGRRLLLLASARDGGRLEPVALLAFVDPLREDVSDSLAMADEAGIQTVLVTGDHLGTAQRIADAAGLPPGLAITGDELAGWSDEQLLAALPELRVVARAVPDHKLRLVDVARRAGRTVAVTGDGVNDGPALQHADVAVSMGSGTAVAREASDLVLGDDSFATLMEGLREGRRMVANIQKGLVFLVSTHVALLGFILIATLYGFSQPLLPIQILWLELFIDISASIAYEREPEEPGQMRRRPRPRNRPLLTRELLLRITGAGAWTAIAALVVMAAHPGTTDEARWVAFNVLVAGQLVRAYANRGLDQPVFRLRANHVLLAACLVGMAAQIAIPYVPPLAEAFRATPLDVGEWLLVAVIALVPAVLAEVVRATRRQTWVA